MCVGGMFSQRFQPMTDTYAGRRLTCVSGVGLSVAVLGRDGADQHIKVFFDSGHARVGGGDVVRDRPRYIADGFLGAALRFGQEFEGCGRSIEVRLDAFQSLFRRHGLYAPGNYPQLSTIVEPSRESSEVTGRWLIQRHAGFAAEKPVPGSFLLGEALSRRYFHLLASRSPE